MFKNTIASTALTTTSANAFFESRVSGESWCGDNSFVATLRALIYPRMKEGESVTVNFSSSTYSKRILEQDAPSNIFNSICGQFSPEEWNEYGWRDGLVYIHQFARTSEEDNEAWIKFVEKEFVNVHRDWYRIDKVTDFYRKVFNVACFVHPTTRTVAIFCDKLNYRTLHYLQCGILAFMPWYFDQESGVTELEMELIESLRMKTSQKYEECLKKIADQYDFETERIKSLLEGFELQYERDEIERNRQMLDDVDRLIKQARESIVNYMNQRSDVEVKIMGLEKKIEQGSTENEVMDYFLTNKHIYLESVSGTQIRFMVKAFLEYFDPEGAEAIIKNKRSYLYRSGGSISEEDMEKFARAVFIDEELKIQFCAAYWINLRNGGGDGIGHYSFDSRFNDAMPNPHVQQYTCVGGYLSEITEAVIRHDAVLAITTCISSCKSLNVNESATMQVFVDYLHNNRNKCVQLPDGTMATVKGAIEYLKQREEQGNE